MGHLIVGDFLEVVVEQSFEAGLLKVFLAEHRESLLVEVVLEMFQSEGIVEDLAIVGSGGALLHWDSGSQCCEQSNERSPHVVFTSAIEWGPVGDCDVEQLEYEGTRGDLLTFEPSYCCTSLCAQRQQGFLPFLQCIVRTDDLNCFGCRSPLFDMARLICDIHVE